MQGSEDLLNTSRSLIPQTLDAVENDHRDRFGGGTPSQLPPFSPTHQALPLFQPQELLGAPDTHGRAGHVIHKPRSPQHFNRSPSLSLPAPTPLFCLSAAQWSSRCGWKVIPHLLSPITTGSLPQLLWDLDPM